MPHKDPEVRKKYLHDYRKKWRKERGKIWYQRQLRNRKLIYKKINEYKRSKSCADCGYSNKDFPLTLDFDHVRGKKLFNIAAFNGVGWERIKKEIEKCDIVCSNCHRIRSQKRINTKKHAEVILAR